MYLIKDQVIIPLDSITESKIWIYSRSGDLNLKEAYNFKSKIKITSSHPWAKHIWNVDISPSKAFIIWRLFHNRFPTHENIILRGCYIPSMYTLCNSHQESSFLFPSFCFAYLSLVFFNMMKLSLVSDILRIFEICDMNWSPKCRVIIQVSIVNIINNIWMTRNLVRFHNYLMYWKKTLNQIFIEVAFIENITTKMASFSIHKFTIIKTFNVKLTSPKAPRIIEFIWKHLVDGWLKCKTENSFSVDVASGGGFFRNSLGDFVFSFVESWTTLPRFMLSFLG